ncbi:MAG: hypothetical protein JWO42_1014 [Chloroflexi bacterium]|nr:hypothetical protein [Chloroflexota bacterium]
MTGPQVGWLKLGCGEMHTYSAAKGYAAVHNRVVALGTREVRRRAFHAANAQVRLSNLTGVALQFSAMQLQSGDGPQTGLCAIHVAYRTSVWNRSVAAVSANVASTSITPTPNPITLMTLSPAATCCALSPVTMTRVALMA